MLELLCIVFCNRGEEEEKRPLFNNSYCSNDYSNDNDYLDDDKCIIHSSGDYSSDDDGCFVYPEGDNYYSGF